MVVDGRISDGLVRLIEDQSGRSQIR
jgi:hypothetical protein